MAAEAEPQTKTGVTVAAERAGEPSAASEAEPREARLSLCAKAGVTVAAERAGELSAAAKAEPRIKAAVTVVAERAGEQIAAAEAEPREARPLLPVAASSCGGIATSCWASRAASSCTVSSCAASGCEAGCEPPLPPSSEAGSADAA